MKRNAALWSVCCLITALVLPRSAAADPISVTGGSLQMVRMGENIGQVSLIGERGFFLTSSVIAVNGFYAPGTECGVMICLPGSEVSLRAMFGGSDLTGQLGFDGRVYDDWACWTRLPARWSISRVRSSFRRLRMLPR